MDLVAIEGQIIDDEGNLFIFLDITAPDCYILTIISRVLSISLFPYQQKNG
jgi:hypothetical protein